MEQIYQGIIPYDEEGRNRFTGRAAETRQLFERILRNDYTVYYAASGEGKSSLIRAGLLPILRRRGFFPIYIVFQEGNFTLDADLTDVVFSRMDEELNLHPEISKVPWYNEHLSISELNPELLSELEKNSWWKMRSLRLVSRDEPLTPLFIFDQFEEVFTKATYEWTDHFFQWLEDVTTDYLPKSLSSQLEQWEAEIEIPTRKSFKALFSLRTEYLGELDYWCIQKHFLPSLQDNRICLKPMTPEGAFQVIQLNESALGAHAIRIIDGCSEEPVHDENSDKPLVSALILSVVCLTLSNMPEGEREKFLDDLDANQESAVNNILLQFYKTKLQSAGLNYEKDTDYIRQIEDAFVDVNGKRRRRNTDEKDLGGILRWVDALCAKENGLIKVIGRRESDEKVIKTVEFPHDRLCKAINVAREERQGMMAERIIRQGEWMQFGLISAILFIIALFWHYMIDALAPIIEPFLYGRVSSISELFAQHDSNVDKSLSTLLLMVFLLILAPTLVMSVVRKTKRGQVVAAVTSLIGLLCFGLLWKRISDIDFSSRLVPTLTIVSFLVCAIAFLVYALRLYSSLTRPSIMMDDSRIEFSRWPLWGGYFVFCGYLFYEFTTRTTFGISGPGDSAWALTAFPLLYGAWAWGFFRMRFSREGKKHQFVPFLLLLVSIAVLTTLGLIPAYNKQSFGLTIALLSLLVYAVSSILLIRQTVSQSRFYELSTAKRIEATLGGVIVLFTVFILNLGYNPLTIPPSRVHNVSSWRMVTVADNTNLPLEKQRFGGLLATNGDTIVPFVKQLKAEQIDYSLALKDTLGWINLFSQPRTPYTIRRHFPSNPFFDNRASRNDIGTITWDSDSMVLEVLLAENPVLQQHLHRITRRSASKQLHTVQDSVAYFSAQLYKQLYRTSINYISQGEPYDISSLGAYHLLDSLQHVILEAESVKLNKLPADFLEDIHFVDFFREVSRWFLLCTIKERINLKDYISEFTLITIYPFCFFPNIYVCDTLKGYNSINMTSNKESKRVKVVDEHITISDEIYSGKAFPWYNLFRWLCSLDMAYNYTLYEKNLNRGLGKDELAKLESIVQELKEKRDQNIAWDLTKLEEWNDIIKSTESDYYNEMDEEFMWAKQLLFDTLISIVEKSPNGVYNNAMLTVCEYLIKVAVFRGYDINDDLNRIENSSKDEFLEFSGILKEFMNENRDLKLEIRKIIDERIRLIEYLDSLGIDMSAWNGSQG